MKDLVFVYTDDLSGAWLLFDEADRLVLEGPAGEAIARQLEALGLAILCRVLKISS